MFFSLRGGVPLDLSVFLGRERTPHQTGVSSLSLKPTLSFPTAKGLCPLESCMGFRVFDRLKPIDCSFAENISCRLSAPSPVNLCKFACGKLGANRRPNYICKTDFHCSPRTVNQVMSVRPIHPVRLAPFRTVPLHRAG